MMITFFEKHHHHLLQFGYFLVNMLNPISGTSKKIITQKILTFEVDSDSKKVYKCTKYFNGSKNLVNQWCPRTLYNKSVLFITQTLKPEL